MKWFKNLREKIVDIEFYLKIIFIVWIGTHAEYDKIDAKTIVYDKTVALILLFFPTRPLLEKAASDLNVSGVEIEQMNEGNSI